MFEPMSKGHRRYSIDMFRCDGFRAKICCIGLSCPAHDDISSMSVYIKLDVDERDQFSNIKGDGYLFFHLSCSCDARTQILISSGVFGKKCLRRGLEAFA